jgi:hypothetical protein
MQINLVVVSSQVRPAHMQAYKYLFKKVLGLMSIMAPTQLARHILIQGDEDTRHRWKTHNLKTITQKNLEHVLGHASQRFTDSVQ